LIRLDCVNRHFSDVIWRNRNEIDESHYDRWLAGIICRRRCFAGE
jgi:hypothetical protein